MGINRVTFYRKNHRLLTPLEEEDLEKLKNWRNAQIEILRQRQPLTSFHQEEWYPKAMKDDNQVLFSIWYKDTEEESKRVISYCGLVYIDYENSKAELSFINKPNRASNDRIFREDFLAVLFMLCKYGFEELNLHKIYTETFDIQERVPKILNEFGFHLDGRLRDHHYTQGKYYDSLIHSLLRSEWKRKR